MMLDSIVTAVRRGNRNRDHLPLHTAEDARSVHCSVVEREMSFQDPRCETVNFEDVGHSSGLPSLFVINAL